MCLCDENKQQIAERMRMSECRLLDRVYSSILYYSRVLASRVIVATITDRW